jgi:hypothetical protein
VEGNPNVSPRGPEFARDKMDPGKSGFIPIEREQNGKKVNGKAGN